MSVKRFDFTWDGMECDSRGDYVLAADYDALLSAFRSLTGDFRLAINDLEGCCPSDAECHCEELKQQYAKALALIGEKGV